MFKELREIDFSGGIRSENIQHNFEAVDDMIARERLAIAGHGIASGLQFEINGFELTVKEGYLVDLNGKEVYIPETTLKVPLPKNKKVKEEVFVVEHDGTITLPFIPYSPTGKHVATVEELNNGITITNFTNSLQKYACRAIRDNKISIDASIANETVKVSYEYTHPRIDTVYITEDHEIDISYGTHSSSPSITLPDKYTYLLGFIDVDPYDTTTAVKSAKLKIKQDLKSLRNIFTDSDNRLWICGTPFDDLQIIHMEEPKDPHENQLWFDTVALKLRVWKTIDGIGQWVNVNDTSVVPVLEHKMWVPSEEYLDSDIHNELNPEDGMTFLFHAEEDMHMRFIPGKNELGIYVEQGILHSDQFIEITLEEAKTDNKLKDKLINEFGYTVESIEQCNEAYENIGVGFRLAAPLTKPCFVEARVTHRVNENPLRVRFQRTANFTFSKYLIVDSRINYFHTDRPYRYGENQLEVYLNGRKLINELEYKELPDIITNSDGTIDRGTLCKSFEILTGLAETNKLEYRINETIYSYDHLDKLIGENVNVELDEVKLVSQEALSTSNKALVTVEDLNADHSAAIKKLEDQNKDHELFIKSTDKIGLDLLADEVANRLPSGPFNQLFNKQGQIKELYNLSINDFILAINQTNGKVLVRKDNADAEGDYIIEKNGSGSVFMVFNQTGIPDGTPIYLTGLRF